MYQDRPVDKMTPSIGTLVFFLAVSPMTIVIGEDWGYSPSEDWDSIDGSECDGPHQSPIDLLNICYNNTQITIDKDLTIYLENYNQTISGDKVFLKNNGHTVEVGIVGGMEVQPWAPRIFGTATEEQTYQLAQVHFHWDRVREIIIN